MGIERVGVVGCGLMGSGIAQVCARAGLDVVVREVNQGALEAGRKRIESSLERAVRSGKLPEADRAKVQSACDRMEKRLEIDVPRQDTTAVVEMQKRGLHVIAVSSPNATEFRSVAEEFATAMAGIRIPADVLALARKERDAFRAKAGVH